MGILNIIPQKLRLAGRPVYYSRRVVDVFCSWQQPAGHAAVTKRGDKLAFARHDASMWLQKVCVRASERACKRASISRTRSRSFRCNSRSSDPNFSSPRNGTVLFALVICAGCDLSSVFSKPSPGHGAPNESFVSFYCSVVRIVRFHIISAITVVSVLQKLDTLLAQCPWPWERTITLNRVVSWINYKYRSLIYRKKFQIITYLKRKNLRLFWILNFSYNLFLE